MWVTVSNMIQGLVWVLSREVEGWIYRVGLWNGYVVRVVDGTWSVLSFEKGWMCRDILSNMTSRRFSNIREVDRRDTEWDEEVCSARFWTRDKIWGVTLKVKLKLNRFRATAAARNTASRIYRCNLQLVQHKVGQNVIWWIQYCTNHPAKTLTSFSWYSEYSRTIASWIALAIWNCSIGCCVCSSKYWHLGRSCGDALNEFNTVYTLITRQGY